MAILEYDLGAAFSGVISRTAEESGARVAGPGAGPRIAGHFAAPVAGNSRAMKRRELSHELDHQRASSAGPWS
jgi:hypothetical protein